MNYILRQIEESINLYSNESRVKIYHQIRAEFSILLLLAYLWDVKMEKQGFGKKKKLIERIQKPTIGSIVNIAKELDNDNEFFKDGNSEIFEYIDIRNNLIGHGYSFNDNVDEFVKQFDEYHTSLLNLNVPIFNKDLNIIVVTDYDDGIFLGYNYSASGEILKWQCSDKIKKFKINNVYATHIVNEYFRLSPFIHIIHPRKFYTFIAVEELLLGQIKYNRIDDVTEQNIFTWEEIYKEFSASDGIRKRTVNNTIINTYENNYTSFIDIGLIKDSIYEFLNGSKRKSSVCSTVWGHGGVGKTATVQNICEILSNDLNINQNDKFDYIVFLTAKDRRYDFYLAKTEEIDITNRIVTYDDLIRRINVVINKIDSSEIDGIQNFKGRMLIIIDDFETFEDTEKQKIVDFIDYLDINHHKVIITTRNKFLVVGKEISTSELNTHDTQKFLIQVLEKYYNYTPQNIKNIENELIINDNLSKIHTITTGRPLFIFVFANYLIQCGSIKIALKDTKVQNIKTSDEAINFLFGKVYDQLSTDNLAKEIYVTIGLLTPEDRLTSLKSHLKYIVNAQTDTEFETSLGKLIDLKIIEIIDNTFYKVYSKEILSLMKDKYKEHRNRSKLNERFNKIQKYIHKETGEALFLNADNSRFSEKPEEFVISTYKEVIRSSFSDEVVKTKALLNLTDYLYNQRGNKILAIQTFEDYPELLIIPECVTKFSEYLWSLKEKKLKEKSVEVLSNYFHGLKQNHLKISNENRLQVLALLVLRKCLIAIEHDYNDQNLKTIYNIHGNVLFVETKKVDINKIEPNVRQDILTALLSLVDVCFKVPELNRHGNDIAKYVLEEVQKIPSHIQKQFELKLRNKNVKFQQNYLSPIESKAVQNQIYRGSIKKNGLKEGYGFIEVDELDMDVFFHKSTLKNTEFEELLEYDLVDVIIKVLDGRYSIINNNYSARSVKAII